MRRSGCSTGGGRRTARTKPLYVLLTSDELLVTSDYWLRVAVGEGVQPAAVHLAVEPLSLIDAAVRVEVLP